MLHNLFIADFACGRARLVKAKLWKETDKTYIIGDTESLLEFDFCLPKRLLKNKYHCFSSGQGALTFLLERAEQWVVRCQEQLIQAQKERDRMRNFYVHISSKPEEIENDLA